MTYFKRHIDQYLEHWKNSESHKPLLLRGARQVGKSSAVRNLGKSFEYYIEIDLEKRRDIISLFTDNIDIKMICAQISAIFKTPIIPGKTLLFIDEIQLSERAIASLRYFYEDYSDLHVVAAGSLLEFALREIPSFGVGRIRSLYMYPFSFDEFLEAQGLDGLVDYKRHLCSPENPLPEAMHNQLNEQLRSFYLTGGMPEAVSKWISTHDYTACSDVHNDILSTYTDDFKKYKSRISPILLSNTLKSVARQAGEKFTLSQIDETTGSRQAKEALTLLTLAGLIIPVTHSSSNGIPLGAEANERYRKYLMLDIGLMQSLLGLKAQSILLSDNVDFVNKGGMSEVFAGLEIIKYSSCTIAPEMYYWVRTQKNALAEVDYVIALNGEIIPIEVKAGTKGSMQSLRQFLDTKHSHIGIRTSMENFGMLKDIRIYPLSSLSTLLSHG